MGRRIFTAQEADGIRDALRALETAEPAQRTRLRARLRSNFGFFVTDFLDTGATSLSATGFDDLVRAGEVSIANSDAVEKEERPGRARRVDTREEWAEW